MDITPYNRISKKHQKYRGRAPGGCRTIINKQEGGAQYQNTSNTWLIIPRPLRTFGKQLGPTGSTPNILLWLLPAQYSTHDLRNAKQMANKKMLIGKTPLDTAYHRIHANTTTASTCITIVDELLFLCLVLPFGTTPAPSEYTTVSEVAIDIGKNLLRDESWDTDYLK